MGRSGNAQALLEAANVTSRKDDADLAGQIENSQYGVGFFGYAYYRDRAETLQALPVENKRPSENAYEESLGYFKQK